MSECAICKGEDATHQDFCEYCFVEMKGESDAAGQDFSEYWALAIWLGFGTFALGE